MWNDKTLSCFTGHFRVLENCSRGHDGDRFDLDEAGLSSKDDYLAFVRNWKISWSALVADIREQKARRRLPAKEGQSSAQSRCALLRDIAHKMLRLRIAAKRASKDRARLLAAA